MQNQEKSHSFLTQIDFYADNVMCIANKDFFSAVIEHVLCANRGNKAINRKRKCLPS